MAQNNNHAELVGDRVKIQRTGKKGTYEASFWHAGEHRRLSLRTTNKKLARQKASQIDIALQGGSFEPTIKPVAIQDAIARFIDFKKTEDRAPKTVKRYTGQLQIFCEFLATQHVTKLHQMTALLMDDFRAFRRKTNIENTTHKDYMVISQLFRWCRERRLIAMNPLAEYRMKKPKAKKRGGPSLQQVESILSASDEPRKTQFSLLAFTGMRSGEMRHLLVKDVDLEADWIHIVSRPGARTKTGEDRKVPIHPRLKDLLGLLPRSKDQWFFTSQASRKFPDGDHWLNTKALEEYFLAVLKKLDLPAGRKEGFTVHSLRHFFKTFCINNGVPKPVVDDWQGHGSMADASDHYYSLADEDSQRFMKQVPFGTGKPAADAGTQEV